MNFPEFFSGDGGGDRPSPRKELQGPRPTALKVNKDSYKIRKPPVAPPPHHHPPQPQAPAAEDHRQPVIIYAVSPKVIHTTVSDFMTLVQRLTGNTTDDNGAGPSCGGDVSPAARLASIEKTSPSYKDRETSNTVYDNNNSNFNDDMMGALLEDTADVEMGRLPGILSPAPGSLPPISPGFFSPAVDPFMMNYNYNNNNNMFITSPSTLFSAPMVSPSPSSSNCDLFNPFFDF